MLAENILQRKADIDVEGGPVKLIQRVNYKLTNDNGEFTLRM
jgi:hypothetical protein